MGSTQGEIRVGPSHQARLPEYRPGMVLSTEVCDLPLDADKEQEDLRWLPAKTLDVDLLMYLRAARSMAAFAGMCDGGSPDDGCVAASRDDTTINALDVLHDCGYDHGKALQALVKCPVPRGMDKKWSEEETKRFVKGLRQYGKNFFRIKKELLPHKDTPELVEFYYLWKKTPGANHNRPHRRRRPGSLRRIRNTRNTNRGQPKEIDVYSSPPVGASRPSPTPKENGEGSSGSEDENSEDDSDSRDPVSYRCQHCYVNCARDSQTGKDRLCTDCLTHLKKYGELPQVQSNSARGDTPYLFRPVQTESSDQSTGRMRTRFRTKEKNARVPPYRGSGAETPDSEMDKKLCKSTASNVAFPGEKTKKKSKLEHTTKGRKRNQVEMDNDEDKEITLFKRKRNDRADSPAESLTTDSGSIVDDGENNEPENESPETASSDVSLTTLNPSSGINSSAATLTSSSSIETRIATPLHLTNEDNINSEHEITKNISNNSQSSLPTNKTQASTIIVANNLVINNFKTLNKEGICDSIHSDTVQPTTPVISIKVPMPVLSSAIEDGTDKTLRSDGLVLSTDNQGLEKEKSKILSIQQTPGLVEDFPTPEHRSVIKVENESVRIKRDVKDKCESSKEIGTSLMKGYDEIDPTGLAPKVIIKEEVDNSNRCGMFNVPVPLPTGSVIIKEEMQTSQAHGSLIGGLESMVTNNLIFQGSGFNMNATIKSEPGLSREQSNSPITTDMPVSLSTDNAHLPIPSNLLQIPPNMSSGNSKNLSNLSLHHGGVRTPPAHIQAMSGSSIIHQCTDMRHSEIPLQENMPQMSDLRQSSTDMSIRQQNTQLCASDMRTHVSDLRQQGGVHIHVGDICQNLESSHINNSLNPNKSLLQHPASNSEADKDHKSMSQPPPSISSPHSVILQQQSMHTISNTAHIGSSHQNYSFLSGSPYTHQRQSHSLSADKNVNVLHLGNSSFLPSNAMQPQNEPQNLKIKQEIIPIQEQNITSDPLQSLKEVKIPGYSGPSSSISQPLTSTNITSNSSLHINELSRPSSGNPPPPHFLGPSIDNIKKEPENFSSTLSNIIPSKSPLNQHSKIQSHVASLSSSEIQSNASHSLYTSPLSQISTSTSATLPLSSHPSTVSHSAANLISSSPSSHQTSLPSGPTSIPQPVMHPSQQGSPLSRQSPGHPHPHSSPFLGPPGHPALHPHHPHHALIHHQLFAAAAAHAAAVHNQYHPHHPYAAYGYPFPYPYGPPMPQPHPVPPPHHTGGHDHRSSHEQPKLESRTSSALETTSLHTSHQSSLSSVTTRREISEESNSEKHHHHSQELTTTHHHHQSSHHSSVHHQISTEKQSAHHNQPPVNHSMTISHSSTSSSSASVQHKINTGGKGSVSSQSSSPSCHVSATLSSTTSASTSISLPSSNHGNHHHSHHHAHSHHHQHHQLASGDSLSPSTSMMMPSGMNVTGPNGSRSHHSGLSSHGGHSHQSKQGRNTPTNNTPLYHPSSNHPGLMAQPGIPTSLAHHTMGMGLSPATMPGSSLEALRAHAQAAASIQHQSQGVPAHSPLQGHSVGAPHHHSGRHLSPEDVKTEPLCGDVQDQLQQEDEETPSPNHVPRGPSPEPKIEDAECHRSQSAIFLRHWNRGDFNSCTRTDLTFKPVPDSKLARKREERLRKQAEREREEREKVASLRKMTTPEKPETHKPPSRGPIETITSPYDRFNSRQGYPDTPALRQLSEYARPHAGFSPGSRSAGLGLPPQCIDPMLHYQLNSMYGAGARERLELEREKREREIGELRERELNDRIKEELMKNAGTGPIDPHWMELHRRYASLGPAGPPAAALHQYGLYSPSGGPSQAALSQMERDRLERLGIPTGPNGPQSVGPSGPHPHPHPNSVAAAQLEAAERLALATDPMVRLQMAGISPEYHAHTHAHTHAHSHTHLHLHPSQQAQAQQEAAAGFPLPASGYPRPSILPSREATLGLHPSELLGRGPSYDQLAHQLSTQAAHEQLQRQMLLEGQRFPHPSLVAQHEEYIRQQREREMKVRALEEAARGSRP